MIASGTPEHTHRGPIYPTRTMNGSSPLISLMKEPSNILLLDGGISTELEQCQPNHEFPDRNLWSSSLLLYPKGQSDIQGAHESFYSAGSDIITTLTYQLSHYATKFGYRDEQIDEMLKRALHIANEARAHCISDGIRSHREENDCSPVSPKYIVASIGCYGAVLADGSEYTGDYNLTMEDLIQFHERRTKIFTKEEDIDGIAFETIPSNREVEAICRMMKSTNYDGAVWLSLACKADNGLCLNDGTTLSETLRVIDEIDPNGTIIHGIGVNCCKVQHVYELSQLLAASILESKHSAPSRARAVVIYPNSGEEWDASKNSWIEGSGCTNPQAFARESLQCIKGIHKLCHKMNREPLTVLVGGCCRTTPATIRAIRHAVDKYKTELHKSIFKI